MSRSITIAGTERADLTRLESFSFQESAYRGEVGQGGFDVESPAGAVTVGAWRDVLANDSDGGRIFTGETIDRGVGRGSFTTDAEATWDVQVIDINTILDDPLLRFSGWNRPEETDVARIQYLVTWLNGEGYSIGDDYLDTANPETLDAYDYRKTGSYPRTVADTCAEQTGKSFYLFYDEGVTNVVQFWYGNVVDNTRVSAYRISSVDTDIDDYGMVWPAEWPEESGLQQDPSRVYSAIQVIYGTAPSQVFVTRGTTEAAFKRRETSLFDDSVKTATSATRLANVFLDNAETEENTVTVAVTVPVTHVNAFQHGQTIEVKFPHLGLDDWTGLYCVRRTIDPAGSESKAPDRYHVTLVLKDGVKVTRFGGRGDQPEEPPSEDASADTETVPGACATPDSARVDRSTNPEGVYLEELDSAPIQDYVGSWVAFNQAYTVAGCPIGGGAWAGWEDSTMWYEFTAPADDPGYLGLQVTVDATAVAGTSPIPGGIHIKIASGSPAASRYGEGSPIGSLAIGTSVTITVPRSHVVWGATNSLVLEPDWLSFRNPFFCNPISNYFSPAEDGRGNSGRYRDWSVSDLCPLQFVAGTSGSSGWVAGYGAVDGANATFTLIDWSTTGVVESSINGLIQPGAELLLDTGAGTVTMASPPPAGSVVLFLYLVAA